MFDRPNRLRRSSIARNDDSPGVVAQVKRVLTHLQDSAPGRQLLKGIDTTRFVSASDADFEVVRKFLVGFNRLVKKQK